MARNPKFSRPLFDPIELDHDVKYDEQGITRLSNIDSVVERDDAGNVVFREDQENQLLSIETIYKKILNSSVIKVLDTQFNYFKFPVRVNETEVDINLDVDLEIEGPAGIDNISTRLTIPIPLDSNSQPQNTRKINTSEVTDWFYSGAQNSSGYKELPFSGGTQTIANAYTITKETLSFLREQNKTLRFKFATQYRSTVTNQRVSINTRLTRQNITTYRPISLIFNKNQNASGGLATDTNPLSYNVNSSDNDYPYLSATYFVDINEAQADDTYKLSAVASAASVVLSENCYWDIDVVDIPPAQDELYKNIYRISQNTTVLEVENGAEVIKLYRNETNKEGDTQIATVV